MKRVASPMMHQREASKHIDLSVSQVAPVKAGSLHDQLGISVLAVLLSGAGQKLQCLAVTRQLSRQLSPSFSFMLSLCAHLRVIKVHSSSSMVLPYDGH